MQTLRLRNCFDGRCPSQNGAVGAIGGNSGESSLTSCSRWGSHPVGVGSKAGAQKGGVAILPGVAAKTSRVFYPAIQPIIERRTNMLVPSSEKYVQAVSLQRQFRYKRHVATKGPIIFNVYEKQLMARLRTKTAPRCTMHACHQPPPSSVSIHVQ